MVSGGGKNKKNGQKFPLTKRGDGRWQKVHQGKRYYFTGSAEVALEAWESLRESLTQSLVQTSRDAELCQTSTVTQIPVGDLLPAEENDDLYGEIHEWNSDIQELASSINEKGVLQPLVVSGNFPHIVISGHRRLAASKICGLENLPCIVLRDVNWSSLDKDGRLQILREHNRSRHKSVDQQIREAMLDLNPDDAARELYQLRQRSIFRPEQQGVTALRIEGQKRRCVISDQKSDHVKFIRKVVFEDRREYWPLSVRGIHYPLLNYEFMRNIPRQIRYVNNPQSYSSTSELCTRLRLLGEIPWESIDDGTRPFKEYRAFSNVTQFIRQEIDGLFGGYWRDYLQTQPNYVEVLCEKNTVYHMTLKVTQKYQIPTTSGRGFCSIDPWHDLVERYRNSGKERLILIVLSDFDPEGEMIPHVGGRTLRDDFGVPGLKIIKAGVTREQIKAYDLPKQNFAKESSSNHDWFTKRNEGDESVYELEALDPAVMLEDLENIICSVLDMDLFEKEVERERDEAGELMAKRKTVAKMLRDLKSN